MNKSKNGDLTSGPILKNLAELALPIMISSMLGTASVAPFFIDVYDLSYHDLFSFK